MFGVYPMIMANNGHKILKANFKMEVITAHNNSEVSINKKIKLFRENCRLWCEVRPDSRLPEVLQLN